MLPTTEGTLTLPGLAPRVTGHPRWRRRAPHLRRLRDRRRARARLRAGAGPALLHGAGAGRRDGSARGAARGRAGVDRRRGRARHRQHRRRSPDAHARPGAARRGRGRAAAPEHRSLLEAYAAGVNAATRGRAPGDSRARSACRSLLDASRQPRGVEAQRAALCQPALGGAARVWARRGGRARGASPTSSHRIRTTGRRRSSPIPRGRRRRRAPGRVSSGPAAAVGWPAAASCRLVRQQQLGRRGPRTTTAKALLANDPHLDVMLLARTRRICRRPA